MASQPEAVVPIASTDEAPPQLEPNAGVFRQYIRPVEPPRRYKSDCIVNFISHYDMYAKYMDWTNEETIRFLLNYTCGDVAHIVMASPEGKSGNWPALKAALIKAYGKKPKKLSEERVAALLKGEFNEQMFIRL